MKSLIDREQSFPSIDSATWRRQVEDELKGQDFDRALVTRLLEGIDLAPLYDSAPECVVPLGGTRSRTWEPRSASRLGVALGEEPAFVALEGEAALESLPSGVVGLSLPGRARMSTALEMLRPCEPLTLQELRLGIDPLGALARHGVDEGPLAELAGEWSELPELSGVDTVCALRVDTGPYHDAGADGVQELAIALSTLHAYLMHLPEGDSNVPIEVSFEVGKNVALEIAKLRAARVSIAKLLSAWKRDVSTVLHANTSRRMLTRYDPWVNVLRGTNAVFAAMVAGADSILCRPYDERLGEPSAQALRLARNTQLVLAKEGHLDRVRDPARGAFAIESLTDTLARRAWALFQEIEEEGGLEDALRSGSLRERIDRAHEERAKRIASRREPITGVSEFPLTGEKLPRREKRTETTSSPSTVLAPFVLRADAGLFEALRDAAQGDPLLAFLATLGPRAEHGPRSSWTHNLLLAGGFEVKVHEGTGDRSPEEAAGELAAAAKQSGARVLCLCASDERQATHGSAAVRALAELAPLELVWAGRPGERESELRALGVTDFCFAGGDVLALLKKLLEATGRTKEGVK
ncbi:MAG: methylmalonyl-CoA mutase family protein [Planctomycetota bacterium]